MNLESKIRWSSSYFRLFMQLCTCYAVFFLSVACHFSKLFGHCDKCIQCHSIACNIWFPHTDQWKWRNTEPVKSWTCFSILEIQFHLSYIFLKEKKLTDVISEIPVSSVPPVPGRVETPDVAVRLRTAEKRCSGVASQSPATPTCLNRLFPFLLDKLYRL